MSKSDKTDQVDAERRKALARLGLGAATVYATPVITRLSQAQAESPSHGHHGPPPPPPRR